MNEEEMREHSVECPFMSKAVEIAIAFFGFGYGSEIVLTKLVQLIELLPDELKIDSFKNGRRLAEEERLKERLSMN